MHWEAPFKNTSPARFFTPSLSSILSQPTLPSCLAMNWPLRYSPLLSLPKNERKHRLSTQNMLLAAESHMIVLCHPGGPLGPAHEHRPWGFHVPSSLLPLPLCFLLWPLAWPLFPALGLRHWLLPCLESFPTGIISAEILLHRPAPHPTLCSRWPEARSLDWLSSEHQPLSGMKSVLPEGRGSVCFSVWSPVWHRVWTHMTTNWNSNWMPITVQVCTPMFIAVIFIIVQTWKQTWCPSADEWIRKLWYIYTMEYYSAIKKNSFESVLMRWMKLEPIIQSEVSQKHKDHYSILTHIYGI